eukprot:TRINITY_DN6552_c0_g1_i1.p1 TRINITY_DN6552_c0_g1~~TRINITY_DN6552_c0_g1_i1.p1  ORF type:complete len:946 (+),score=151.03 TRINITY_DN6552_c0_g1_i1:32-2869(+)
MDPLVTKYGRPVLSGSDLHFVDANDSNKILRTLPLAQCSFLSKTKHKYYVISITSGGRKVVDLQFKNSQDREEWLTKLKNAKDGVQSAQDVPTIPRRPSRTTPTTGHVPSSVPSTAPSASTDAPQPQPHTRDKGVKVLPSLPQSQSHPHFNSPASPAPTPTPAPSFTGHPHPNPYGQAPTPNPNPNHPLSPRQLPDQNAAIPPNGTNPFTTDPSKSKANPFLSNTEPPQYPLPQTPYPNMYPAPIASPFNPYGAPPTNPSDPYNPNPAGGYLPPPPPTNPSDPYNNNNNNPNPSAGGYPPPPGTNPSEPYNNNANLNMGYPGGHFTATPPSPYASTVDPNTGYLSAPNPYIGSQASSHSGTHLSSQPGTSNPNPGPYSYPPYQPAPDAAAGYANPYSPQPPMNTNNSNPGAYSGQPPVNTNVNPGPYINSNPNTAPYPGAPPNANAPNPAAPYGGYSNPYAPPPGGYPNMYPTATNPQGPVNPTATNAPFSPYQQPPSGFAPYQQNPAYPYPNPSYQNPAMNPAINTAMNAALNMAQTPSKNPADYQFYWYDNTSGWIPYAAEQNQQLAKGYIDGTPHLKIQSGATVFLIDLVKMMQANSQDKTLRKIDAKMVRTGNPAPPFTPATATATPATADGHPPLPPREVGKWYWDAAGKFMPFDEKCNTIIETAYQKKSPVATLSINGQNYTITFATMIQMNDKTKVSRKVRRDLVKESVSTPRTSKISTVQSPTPISNISPKDITMACPLVEGQQANLDLIKITKGTQEWKTVEDRFNQTMLGKGTITELVRVSNKNLWKKFVLEREQVMEKNANESSITYTRLLFHGTRNTSPSNIYNSESGFMMQFCSKGMWGIGTYFAEKAVYSHDYCHPTADGKKQIFLAVVITGDTHDCPPDRNLKVPPERKTKKTDMAVERYDSVTGITNGSRVYIVYENNKAYPLYLITYR